MLDEVEQTAWAGLEPDRYAWAAVQHRAATGGVHVHVLAARCDLETGKSLNIAPPGWEQTYGPLVEACNLEHGWSRPDDPARARDQQPGHRAYLEAAALRAGIAREAYPREVIRDYMLQGVEHGTVQDRAGVVTALQQAGMRRSEVGEALSGGRQQQNHGEPRMAHRGPLSRKTPLHPLQSKPPSPIR